MTAPNTTNNVTVRKLADVAEGMWNKSKNAFVNASGDTMTGRLTMENVPINQIVTGTGTAATSSSSGGTTTYFPAKWKFDLGIATPSAGDQLVIKIPVAGHDYGTFMSTDNGTTYYPVAQSTGSTRFTTRYPVNAYVFIVFEEYTGSGNSGQVNDCYAVAGSTGRSAYKVGCWRVVNDYDSGNNYDRLYNANGRFRTGSTGCYPYSIVCLDNTQGYSTLVTSNPGTGTNKNVNTDGKFVFPASILYYSGNNTTAAGALVSSTYATYLALPSVDVRYSSNHTVTFTTNKPVYIECTLNGDGTWSPTSNSITQTLRTGYYYIYLGIAYSTEYQVSLAPEHPLYYYDGTNLVSAEVARGDITAGTNNGELNVAGTDITVYTHPTDAGNKHIPAGGSSGQFLGWDSDGTAKWVANPNVDTKVKATAKSDNVNYKILATASASPSSGAATEAVYDTDITLNPSTNTISANVSGTAASAGKLTTARTTYVTLGTASTSTTRDWSGTTTIPVSGTLGLGNGGTGATSAAGARTNLDVYSKSETESLLNGKVVIVTVLPATGEAGVTYYVKDTSATGVDKYDEYIWAKDAGASTESWIHVGEKSLDLSEYVNSLTTSGTGPLVKSLSKSGNALTATLGTIAIDNLSDWASSTDVTVSSVTYHTWWPVAPTSSNQVYGLSIYNGRLYRVYNNKGTYSVQAYDVNTTYTNKSLGQGYGTCATEAATAAKIVTMSDYVLTTGGIVTVKFTNALCASATMNINGKGAKPIYIKGSAVTANNAATVSAGDTAYFMYDGTAYHLLGTDRAATNPIVNISRSGTTFTATRLDGTTFTFTQQDNNTTYTQAKLGQGYGTCTTAEATAAKSVTLTGYELEPNGVVAVKFTNGLCASATMSINGKTATPIYINGAAVTSTSCKEVLAGDLAFFIYDGSHYQFICTDRISKNGITGLSISGKTITYTRADGSTGTLTTQDTTYTFDGVYNSSSNKAATVSTVTNAVNALDVDDITGFGAGKTLKTLTETDGKIAATFQNISITKSQVSDFSHSHGNITNDGKVGTTADYAVVTTTGGAVTATSLATSSPSTSGNTLEFIDTVSQNSKGKISATKKKVTIDDTYSSTGTNPVSGKAIAAAIETLDVTEVGGDGKYIKKIKEDNGKITATVETMDTTPTSGSTNAVTSGGIKTALDGKAATSHTHSEIFTPGDQRDTATAPTNYNNRLKFAGIKRNSVIGNPSDDAYSYIVGLRGWSNYTGGLAHELAFNNTGIFSRMQTGSDEATWGSWKKVLTSNDLNVKEVRTIPQDISKGANLVVNGTGSMCSNYNWPDFEWVGNYSYNASAGAFRRSYAGNDNAFRTCSEFISVDPNKIIDMSVDINILSELVACTIRMTIAFYDIDKKMIEAPHIMYGANTCTELTQDLNPGDTVVHLASVANWTTDIGQNYQRGFIFWDYTNSYGYTYPPETYSRNYYGNYFDSASSINTTNNTITLNKAWAGPKKVAGTKVSKCSSGGTYNYISYRTIDTTEVNTWFHLHGTLTGMATTGDNLTYKFRQGTAFVKVGFTNSSSNANYTYLFTNFRVYELPMSAPKITTARKLAVSLSNTSTDTSFDGSADVTNIKVTGTLPVSNGGTGKTTVTAAEYNLLSKMGTDLSTNAIADNYRFVFATTSPSETNGRLAGYRTATAVWSWIKDKMSSDTSVDISGHADSATHDGNGNTISDNSVYYVAGTTDYPAWQASHAYAINDYAISGGKAYYCKTAHTSGTSFDSSKWTAVATPVIKGTVSNVSALFAGMKIALKWPITGGSSSTYLNINNLGNVYIRRNDGNTTTHVPANTVTFLAYDGTYWRWSDYDSNSTYSGMVTAYINNASDAAKSASSTNFRLTDGITIILTNNAANTKAAALTLNVNSTGAKALYINGNISSATNYTIPIGTYFCHYKVVNGTGQWHLWTDGTAHFTKLHLDTPLPDTEIASAATWNAKQNALTINDSKPITIGTAAAANTVAGQAHTHDGITSVARASVTNIDITNSGTEPARMTLSQVTSATTQGIDPGDGYVLNLLWDNTGNWDTQIYVPNAKKADKDFGHLKIRYKNESSTWGDWEYLPGAFMGTLLNSAHDLDAIPAPQKGTSGEVIQYYWRATSKPKSTSSIGQPGMDGTTGLPSGTGSANLFVFEQSTNRTDARHLIQLMVCADNGIWVRRQFTDVWNVWSKVLTSSDITTNTSTKNGIITVAGTDKKVYVPPVYDAAFNRANVTASADQCWAKIAEMSFDITASYVISGAWRVYCANRYAQTGILEFHSFITASSTSATFGQVELKWIGTEPISFRNYNFCMVLKAKTESGQPVVAELWCQCENAQRGISITEIGGNAWSAIRVTNDRRWVYFNPADSEKTTKPVASETIQVVDPIPETCTKSVYKEFTLPKEQISYIKINSTQWHHQQMFVYSAEVSSTHGEYILRSHSTGNGNASCQVISLCGGQYTENVEWYTKANERYIKFDLSSVTSDRKYRFGLTELSGGRTSDFELVSELPSGVVQITPTGPSARKLDTARELSVDLSSTSTTVTSFDGTQNVSIKNTGTLPISKGGTGKTSVTAGNYLVGNGTNALAEKTPNVAANDLINALPVGDSTPGGDDYYVSQYANGGTTTTTYYRRPIKLLWEYIKTRISSVLGLTATNYGGTAATATTSADTSNELQVVGVQSSATSTLKRDSGVTVQGGAVKATTFKLGTNATITYNSTTEAIDFTFL